MTSPSRLPPDLEERLDWLRLIRTDGVGPITHRALLARFGSAGAALERLPELAARGGRKAVRIPTRRDAEREAAALARQRGRLVTLADPDYPPALAAIEDAPPVIAAIGRLELVHGPTVAIVGARNASVNGRGIAATLARELGAAGWTVVSGLARGIDAAAHQAALATGTAAVMAGGIDQIYPPENAPLADAIAREGLLLAESPMGAEPTARHFPRRNRIVSGLAWGVVVVEAAPRSGSLITARLAGEQGRGVCAVPGSPLDARARGCNALIRDGAVLVETAEQVIESLSGFSGVAERPVFGAGRFAGPEPALWSEAELPDGGGGDAEAAPETLPPADLHETIEGLLGASPTGIDALIRTVGAPAAEVQAALLDLELAGRISRHPGQKISRLEA